MRRPLCLALAVLTLAACSPDPKKDIASVGQALPGLPLPPAARVVGRSGSTNALQINFQSLWSPDSLTEFYRQILSRPPWTLQSDVTDQEGAQVLYATREGPPIWLRITPVPGAPGAFLQMNGAVVPTPPGPDSAPGS